jgi:hypothetical protein
MPFYLKDRDISSDIAMVHSATQTFSMMRYRS